MNVLFSYLAQTLKKQKNFSKAMIGVTLFLVNNQQIKLNFTNNQNVVH